MHFSLNQQQNDQRQNQNLEAIGASPNQNSEVAAPNTAQPPVDVQEINPQPGQQTLNIDPRIAEEFKASSIQAQEQLSSKERQINQKIGKNTFKQEDFERERQRIEKEAISSLRSKGLSPEQAQDIYN